MLFPYSREPPSSHHADYVAATLTVCALHCVTGNVGTGSGIASSLNPLGRYTPPPTQQRVIDNLTCFQEERSMPVAPFSLT